jgi:hypothetical protein
MHPARPGLFLLRNSAEPHSRKLTLPNNGSFVHNAIRDLDFLESFAEVLPGISRHSRTVVLMSRVPRGSITGRLMSSSARRLSATRSFDHGPPPYLNRLIRPPITMAYDRKIAGRFSGVKAFKGSPMLTSSS